jgi:hypothetical protein
LDRSGSAAITCVFGTIIRRRRKPLAPVPAIVKQLVIALAVTAGIVGLVEAMDRPGPSVAVVRTATSPPSTRTTAARHDARTTQPTSGTDTPGPTEFGVTADYLGPIRRASLDASTGISLTIPPANAEPAVTWQQAVVQCLAGAGICSRTAGTVRVSLAVGYDPQSGQASPDGSIRPTMNHDLVHVLAQTSGPCVPAGPAGRTVPPSTYPSCTSLSFLDAHTGRGAISVSGPLIRDPSTADSQEVQPESDS